MARAFVASVVGSACLRKLSSFVKAVALAADKHRNQRRKGADASPYISHAIALAKVPANEGALGHNLLLPAAFLTSTHMPR
jgi:guanosine-3',5'-bis(diphosphate) 3'-pyrophosphohydrolase